MKTGAELIADERKRQIEKEHWSEGHDDEHTDESLAYAAVCYAHPRPRIVERKQTMYQDREAGEFRYPYQIEVSVPDIWPWDGGYWNPKDRISNLVRAGALIAAEIDRLQRAKALAQIGGEGD